MKHDPVTRPDLHQAMSRVINGRGTDEDRTELLGALLQGDLGGSEAWANAIWPVEKAFVEAYPTIIRNQDWSAAA